ncbi:hypothetical protein M408DRAFT_10020 [Serendipita vermifera MAFF 305830]|uniref:Extracellular membrane protein CFEM domain-containing protein n=1 Tax=Serendipita vermifera MAFF 305830 TaxID=933852 RepID=A0A0C3B1W3_SERVB|nr:hypothetical protein M408DRAFT_10020 [Serendipita vermifera MAFF 305830]
MVHISFSLLPLFALAAFAQTTRSPSNDPEYCNDYCFATLRVADVLSINCPTGGILECICTNSEVQTAYDGCLHSLCEAVYDTAAEQHRTSCASPGHPWNANPSSGTKSNGATTNGATTNGANTNGAAPTTGTSPPDLLQPHVHLQLTGHSPTRFETQCILRLPYWKRNRWIPTTTVK